MATIYYQTFSANGVAVQLLENFFNWVTSTMFWLSYTPFFRRMLPIFAPDNNQKNLELFVFSPVNIFRSVLESGDENPDSSKSIDFEIVDRPRNQFRFVDDLKRLVYGDDFVEAGNYAIQ